MSHSIRKAKKTPNLPWILEFHIPSAVSIDGPPVLIIRTADGRRPRESPSM